MPSSEKAFASGSLDPWICESGTIPVNTRAVAT
jgi:hypothetical protein